jgi:MFS family permease
MFPTLAFKSGLQGVPREHMFTLICLIYNVGDTIGKYSVGGRRISSKAKISVLNALRLILIVTSLFASDHSSQTMWNSLPVQVLNSLLNGITNGLLTTIIFILSPSLFPSEKREIVGTLNLMSLYIGLIIGSIIAYPLTEISNRLYQQPH